MQTISNIKDEQFLKIILPVSIVFSLLGSVFVGFYLCSFLFVVKKFRFADYRMFLAWVI